jgi:CubicO group peptidase (beta-lactamase class C family)
MNPVLALASLILAASCAHPPAVPSTRHGRFAPVVTSLADQLEARYVRKDVGARYAAALRANLVHGAYDAIVDRDVLADRLTRDLDAVSHDGHLRVASETAIARPSSGLPPLPRGPNAAPAAGHARPPAIADLGWLADGVAYIRFNEFPGDPETVAAVDRFMAEHASARALIIDARAHHGGGAAEMDAMLPYLYASETVLVDMEAAEQPGRAPLAAAASANLRPVAAPPGWIRREHIVTPHPTEHRLFAAKVFYLTSSRTFSAAEHLGLALKRTGRATLIRERIGGGNHFGGFEPLGDGLFVFLPVGRTFDPVTGADREGVGIAPDIEVPAERALEEALRRATGDAAPTPAPHDMMAAMKDWPRPALRTGQSDAQIAAAITAYAQQLHEAGHFSGVVLAAKADQLVVARPYGLADVASGTPNTLDTRFDIGSIGKMITRVALAQLAAAGKLSLDDTLRHHLPSLPVPGADRITLRQLAEHRSGMGDIFGPSYAAAPPARLRELADFVPLFAGAPLAFEPGQGEQYSNAGYVVLGLVIERVSGEPYRDYVAHHVLAPAGMTATGFWAIDERGPAIATGYTRWGQHGDRADLAPNTEHRSGRPTSAGGALSTVGDLLRFWQALRDHRLTSPAWTSWALDRVATAAGRPRSSASRAARRASARCSRSAATGS